MPAYAYAHYAQAHNPHRPGIALCITFTAGPLTVTSQTCARSRGRPSQFLLIIQPHETCKPPRDILPLRSLPRFPTLTLSSTTRTWSIPCSHDFRGPPRLFEFVDFDRVRVDLGV